MCPRGGGLVCAHMCCVALGRSCLSDPQSPHLQGHSPRVAVRMAEGPDGPTWAGPGTGEPAWGRWWPAGASLCASPPDTCEADCVRKRAEQSLQAAIKTLRKAISRQQFYVQIAGTEYEVAQRSAKALEGLGTCGTGQVLQDGKCGESLPVASRTPPPRPKRATVSAQADSWGTGRRGLPQRALAPAASLKCAPWCRALSLQSSPQS